MPTIAAAAEAVFTAVQAQFTGDSDDPTRWQLVTDLEMAADLDVYNDSACAGLGFVIVTGGNLEINTSQQYGGQLYSRLQVAAGVLRCAPALSDNLTSPTPAQHLAYTRQVLADVERLLQSVWAVAQFSWITEEDITPEPAWTPIETSGGSGGSLVAFELAVIGDCPVGT